MISKLFSRLIIFIGFICTVCSCKDPSEVAAIYMAFDHVEYIGDFPETILLDNGKVPEIDVIGIRDFVIHDSLMVLGTTNPKGIWSLISLPHYQVIGSFLKRGEGPLEFMQGPNTSNKTKFVKEDGQLVAYIYDFQKGKIKKFNIDASVASGELKLSVLEDNFPPFLFNFIMLDSSSFFLKELENKDTQQIRSIITKGKKISSPIIDKLNQAALQEGKDFNILVANTAYNDSYDRFVEAPTGLNYINLYSLDSTLAKTICIGEKLSDIALIQNEFPQWNRKYTFVNLRAFDSFFGVIYVNNSLKDYQTIRNILPSIMLFNWEGEPLVKLKMEKHLTHFDIDLINQELYTFDLNSDEFFKYDVSELLSKLK